MNRELLSDAQAERCRSRIIALTKDLPGATCVEYDNHLSLEVRGKRFGWFLDDHHGDGRIAVHCKSPRGGQEKLIASDPECFHMPKHVGRHGWIGLWLDIPKTDWTKIRSVLVGAYTMTAPKSLLQDG